MFGVEHIQLQKNILVVPLEGTKSQTHFRSTSEFALTL